MGVRLLLGRFFSESELEALDNPIPEIKLSCCGGQTDDSVDIEGAEKVEKPRKKPKNVPTFNMTEEINRSTLWKCMKEALSEKDNKRYEI